jgi:hypothetical protein
MGRVTFEGPIKSNNGFELGTSGSRSSVAGTSIIASNGSVNLVSDSTAATISIGGAITGWNNQPTTLTLSGAIASTMNCNVNSAFILGAAISNATYNNFTVMPVGGYPGQMVTVLWVTGATATSIIFQSSSSVTLKLVGNVTGWAGLAGSTHSIRFLNVGAGLATPTTSAVLLEIVKTTDASGVL